MTLVQTETATQSEVVLTLLKHLSDGKIKDATACFAENFRFSDRGIGLEFKDRVRLAEFFQKTRELNTNAFSSLTMYELPSRLLVANPSTATSSIRRCCRI